MTGNITLNATPTDKKHLVTVEATEDASNLKTGNIKKDLLLTRENYCNGKKDEFCRGEDCTPSESH